MHTPLHLGLVQLEDTIPVWFQTDSSDVPTDADSTPTFSVYEAGSDTPLLSAQTTSKVGSNAGFYRGSIDATAANGFEAGQTYCVRGSWEISTSARADLLTFTVV